MQRRKTIYPILLKLLNLHFEQLVDAFFPLELKYTSQLSNPIPNTWILNLSNSVWTSDMLRNTPASHMRGEKTAPALTRELAFLTH